MKHHERLLAVKHPGYLLEPILSEPNRRWEGHHVTNPTAVRLTGDARVFLGYRAGGTEDRFNNGTKLVWGSHLGLAVLSEEGESLEWRFPLPIFTLQNELALPETRAEFEAYEKSPHRDDIAVLHDFRFWEDGSWLYVIYHAGTVTKAFDCIVKMRTDDFLARVEQSIQLLQESPDHESLRGAWAHIWWTPQPWEPAGVDGSDRIYPSPMSKNDIVFLRLTDGRLLMYHRPVPDIAVVETSGVPYLDATEDGITVMGSLQSCIRPGYTDNSHIGNNGVPIPAVIGEKKVAIDVVHGVGNEAVTDPSVQQRWKLTYYPYLRILDPATGECLYYSEDPILEYDGVWDEYARDGAWIKDLPHLDGVMFAGGQIAVQADRIGVDDPFRAYTGIGDTAIAVAEFRLRDVVPENVLRDIRERDTHRAYAVEADQPVPQNTYEFPRACSGWSWSIRNGPDSWGLAIRRTLDNEANDRLVNTRPGYFDADALYFNGGSVAFLPELGWLVQYSGVRWSVGGSSTSGTGVLLLDRENPERILYRSAVPIPGTQVQHAGWTSAASVHEVPMTEDLIPHRVRAEVKRVYTLQPMPSDMTAWLRNKSAHARQQELR